MGQVPTVSEVDSYATDTPTSEATQKWRTNLPLSHSNRKIPAMFLQVLMECLNQVISRSRPHHLRSVINRPRLIIVASRSG